MKWVRIGKCHINMAEVKFFYWKDGEISIHIRIEERLQFEDPDKKHYHKLCHVMGVRPYEEVRDDT